jgi:Fur family transcriptional regulator, peroxide stress response regulator
MEQINEVCRKHGLPLTVQRRAILEVLSGRKDHPTADHVFESVRQKMPEISRTTVYRVLETFVQLRIIRKVCHPGAAARYEFQMHRHHHLVCLECEAIVDLEDPSLDGLPLPDVSFSFKIEDYSIQFRGLCSRCLREASSRKGMKESGTKSVS